MVLRKKVLLMVGFLIVTLYSSYSQSDHFTSFDGTKIAYDDVGDGFPVVLLHGFINTKASWDKTVLKKELLKKGYRVIVPDLRGNGTSDKPQKDSAYADNAEIKDVKLLLDTLKIEQCFAIGYSRGSIVLAKWLTKEQRIEKAVLGGMGADFTNPNWDRKLLFADAFNGKTTAETQGAVDYAKSIGADIRSLYLQQKYQPVTSLEELAEIKQKVFVIAGDVDTDNGDPQQLKETIPNAVLAIVPGDHNNTYKTEVFSTKIMAFLQK